MLGRLIAFAFACMVLLAIGAVLLLAIPAGILASLPGLQHMANDAARDPAHVIEELSMSTLSIGSLAVFLFMGILVVALLGAIFLGALVIIFRRSTKGKPGSEGNDVDEARLIQEIYHGLLKMETRVEALETLLMERQRKGNDR